MVIFRPWVAGAEDAWDRVKPYFDNELAPVLKQLQAINDAGLLSGANATQAATALDWLKYDTTPIPFAKGQQLDLDITAKKRILAQAISLRDSPTIDLRDRQKAVSEPFFSQVGGWKQLMPQFETTQIAWRALQADLAKPLTTVEQYDALLLRTKSIESAFTVGLVKGLELQAERARLKEAALNPVAEEEPPVVKDTAKPPEPTTDKVEETARVEVEEAPKIVELPKTEELTKVDESTSGGEVTGEIVSGKAPRKPKFVPITQKIAAELVKKHPPTAGMLFKKYVSGLGLKKLGYTTPGEIESGWIRTAWTEALNKPKEAAFKHNDASTWVINPIVYANGLSEDTITSGGDEQAKSLLANIQNGSAKGNTRTGGSVPAKASLTGEVFHNHITNGSGGLSWAYMIDVEGRSEVTPYVYDIATKRDGNKYDWQKGGGKTSETSGASWQ